MAGSARKVGEGLKEALGAPGKKDRALQSFRALTLFQRLPDGLQVSPRQTLLQRLAQQVGRVQGRNRADLARAGVVLAPAAPGPGDPVLQAQQRLGRRPAEAYEDVRVGQLDLALDER